MCPPAGQQWGPTVPGPFHWAITVTPRRSLLFAWRIGSGKKPAVDVSDQKIAEEGKEKKRGKKDENMLDRKGKKAR